MLDGDLNEIDKVIYYSQGPDVSQGRSPDGGAQLTTFETPTPGQANHRPPLSSPAGQVPPGSLIYTSSVDTDIDFFDDVDRFTVAVDDGQTHHGRWSTRTRRSSRTIELLDPTGTTLGSASADKPGDDVLLQPVADRGAGTYTVTIQRRRVGRPGPTRCG